MDDLPFHYAAACDAEGCKLPPCWKIAAAWSHGPLRELKNYGLACERHRDDLVARAQGRREALAVGDDEAVGPIAAFPLRRPDEPTPDL